MSKQMIGLKAQVLLTYKVCIDSDRQVAAAEDMALAASAEQQRLEEIVQQCRIASEQMTQFALGACATVSESLEVR